MSRAQELLYTIASELHIERGEHESIEMWKARTIYSLLGRMAYASLWDHFEEDDSLPGNVSIIHLERRVQVLQESYLELYPEINTIFSSDPKVLSQEIYDIYLKAGCVYHTPFKISCAAPCAAEQSGLRFERGMPLSRRQYVSGLGTYLPDSSAFEGETVCPSVQGMFGLLESTLADFWADLISVADWHPLHGDENMVYLSHMDPRLWTKSSEKGSVISLARTGLPGGYLYYLYQTNGGRQFGSQLSQWLVNDPFYGGISYLTAANACLAAHSCLPEVQYKMDGPIVQVRFPYTPPPAELYWLKLYSWPQFFSYFANIHVRIFSQEVFWAVKAVLEQIGYQFAEE